MASNHFYGYEGDWTLPNPPHVLQNANENYANNSNNPETWRDNRLEPIEIDQLERELSKISGYQQEIKYLHATLASKDAQLDRQDDALYQSLKEEIEDLRADNDRLKRTIQELAQEDFPEKDLLHRIYQEEIVELKERLKKAKRNHLASTDLQKMNDDKEASDQNVYEFERQLSMEKEKAQDLFNALTNANLELKKVLQENHALKAKIETDAKKLADLKAIVEAVNESDHQVDFYKEEVQKLTTTLAAANIKLKMVQDENQKLKTQVEKGVKKFESTEKAKSNLEETVQKLMHERSQNWAWQTSTLKTKYDELLKTNEALVSKIKGLEKDQDRLQRRLDDKEVKLERKIKNYANVKAEKKDYKKSYEEKLRRCEKLEEDLQEHHNAKKKLEKHLAQLQDQVDKLHKSYSILENGESDRIKAWKSTYETKIFDLEGEIRRMTQAQKTLQEDIGKVHEKRNEADAKLTSSQKELEEANQKVVDLTEKLSHFESPHVLVETSQASCQNCPTLRQKLQDSQNLGRRYYIDLKGSQETVQKYELELKTSQEIVQKLVLDLKESESDLKKSETLAQKLVQDLQKSQERGQNLEESVKSLEEDLEAVYRKLEDAKHLTNQTPTINLKTDELETKISNLELRLKEKAETEKLLNQRCAETSKMLDEVMDEKDMLRKKCDALKYEYTALIEEKQQFLENKAKQKFTTTTKEDDGPSEPSYSRSKEVHITSTEMSPRPHSRCVTPEQEAGHNHSPKSVVAISHKRVDPMKFKIARLEDDNKTLSATFVALRHQIVEVYQENADLRNHLGLLVKSCLTKKCWTCAMVSNIEEPDATDQLAEEDDENTALIQNYLSDAEMQEALIAAETMEDDQTMDFEEPSTDT